MGNVRQNTYTTALAKRDRMRPMSTYDLLSKLSRNYNAPTDLQLHQLTTKLSDLYDNATDPTTKEIILLLAEITNTIRRGLEDLEDRTAEALARKRDI